MTVLTSKDTQIRIAGTEVAFTNELLTTTDNKIYKIVDREKSVWSMDSEIIINTIEIDDAYDIDYANGCIVFNKVKNRGDLTVSGDYLTTTSIGKILSYDFEKNREFKSFFFVGALNNENIPLGESMTGQIEQLEIKDEFFLDAFNNADKLLLEVTLFDRVERAWVYIEKHGQSHAGGDLVKNNITFRSFKN